MTSIRTIKQIPTRSIISFVERFLASSEPESPRLPNPIKKIKAATSSVAKITNIKGCIAWLFQVNKKGRIPTALKDVKGVV